MLVNSNIIVMIVISLNTTIRGRIVSGELSCYRRKRKFPYHTSSSTTLATIKYRLLNGYKYEENTNRNKILGLI